jgi:hypothetical protein
MQGMQNETRQAICPGCGVEHTTVYPDHCQDCMSALADTFWRIYEATMPHERPRTQKHLH